MINNTVKKLFWSSRPISWVNTAFPFAAAYLVAVGQFDTTFIVGTLYFLIPYNLLMYGINDVFDYESDRRNPRKQQLEGIVLDTQYHRATLIGAIILNIPFLLWLLINGTTASNIVLSIVIFAVIAYSIPGLRFKERPFLDSITSATHFVGPMLFALVLAGWDTYYLGFVLSFFFWAVASHAFGAVQDVVPDKKAGIASIATVIGARWTVRFSVVMYLVSIELLMLRGFGPLTAGITGILYIINILPFWDLNEQNSYNANRGWRRFIKLNYFTGFVLTLLLLTSSLS